MSRHGRLSDQLPLAVISWRDDERLPVDSPADAERTLDSIDVSCDPSRPPIVLVDRERHGCMDVRLGRPESSLRHVPADGDPPYMVTVGPSPNDRTEVDYWYFGHHTPAIRRNLIPKSEARRCVTSFLEHGTLAPFLTWEQV